MTHNQELVNAQTKFAVSSVAFLFCLIWALVGEADIKIVAVALAFICFLKHGIETEMCARSGHDSH